MTAGQAGLVRSESAEAAARALEQGGGVLRLAPAWVPRSFCIPGRRLKLHPHDYFALGGVRGGIDERWLASAVRADNGPLTGADEGLSFVVTEAGEQLPLDAVVAAVGKDLIGARLWEAHGTWPAYSKFFDNQGALPLHVHQRDEHAALVGRLGKPEAYYFPPQLNNHTGDQPVSFFGLATETTKEEFTARLAGFPAMGDNRITELSRGYRMRLGTGWDMPAGVLHAPASLCTYEPQAASDVAVMCECWTSGRTLPEESMWKDVPEDRRGDVDFIVEILDWQANTDVDFAARHYMDPQVADAGLDPSEAVERWIVYRSSSFSAKELTVAPGATVTVPDNAAYGCIAVQGRGTIGRWNVETPTMISFGELTADEFFVAESAATQGVVVRNLSAVEPLVLLKHFGPGNPDNPYGGGRPTQAGAGGRPEEG